MDIQNVAVKSSASLGNIGPSKGPRLDIFEEDIVIQGIKIPRGTRVLREDGARGRLLRLMVLTRHTRIYGKMYRRGSSVTFDPNTGRVIDGTLVDGRHVRSPR